MSEAIDDGLTPEERAALSEDDGSGEQSNQSDHHRNDGEDQEAIAKAAAESADAEAEANAKKAEADAAAASDAEAGNGTNNETAPTAEAAPASQPILVANPVNDAEARLAEIASEKDKLLEQFDDGDITAREFQKRIDELSKQERRIEFEQHEAQLAAKMEAQRIQNEWNSTCNAFIDSHPAYKEMPWLYMQLDSKVKELAAQPESVSWSGQKFLDEAHKSLKEKYKFPDAEPTQKQKPAFNPAANLPPNLAKVPAAEVEDTSGGRFAVLDRMAANDPLGYEEALAKMPEAERNAYLSS